MSRYNSKKAYGDLILDRLLAGETYVTGTETVLGADGTYSLLVENTNADDLFLYFGSVVHEKTVDVAVYDGLSGVSGGSSAGISPNLIGDTNISGATATSNPDYTVENEHEAGQRYTGGGTADIFNGYKVIVPAGEHIMIEITEPSNGGDDTVAIRIAFAHLTE